MAPKYPKSCVFVLSSFSFRNLSIVGTREAKSGEATPRSAHESFDAGPEDWNVDIRDFAVRTEKHHGNLLLGKNR